MCLGSPIEAKGLWIKFCVNIGIKEFGLRINLCSVRAKASLQKTIIDL